MPYKVKGKQYPHRSKKTMTFHDRAGKPIIHATPNGKEFVMTRKRGGGTKRLYLVHGNVPKKYRQKPKKRRR